MPFQWVLSSKWEWNHSVSTVTEIFWTYNSPSNWLCFCRLIQSFLVECWILWSVDTWQQRIREAAAAAVGERWSKRMQHLVQDVPVDSFWCLISITLFLFLAATSKAEAELKEFRRKKEQENSMPWSQTQTAQSYYIHANGMLHPLLLQHFSQNSRQHWLEFANINGGQ